MRVLSLRVGAILGKVIGAGFLIGAGVAFDHTVSFKRNSERYHGVIVSSGSVCVAEYTGADGVKREVRTSSETQPPAFDFGENVWVRVARDGSKARIDGFYENWFMPLFLLHFALFWGGFGFAFAHFDKKRLKRIAGLKTSGDSLEIEVDVYEGEENEDGDSPYVVAGKAVIDGAEREFRSENLWRDPRRKLGDSKVRVFFAKGNPAEYHMDLDFLED
jgi:hypothetical protein